MGAVDTSAMMKQLDDLYVAAKSDNEFTGDANKIAKAIKGLSYVSKESRRRKQLTVTMRKRLALERDQEFRKSGTYRPVEDHEVLAMVEAELKKV